MCFFFFYILFYCVDDITIVGTDKRLAHLSLCIFETLPPPSGWSFVLADHIIIGVVGPNNIVWKRWAYDVPIFIRQFQIKRWHGSDSSIFVSVCIAKFGYSQTMGISTSAFHCCYYYYYYILSLLLLLFIACVSVSLSMLLFSWLSISLSFVL